MNSAGTYAVTVTTTCGESMDEVEVTVDNQAPTVDLGENFNLCPGESATLDATTTGGSLCLARWKYRIQLYSVNNAGTYAVTVTTTCGRKHG